MSHIPNIWLTDKNTDPHSRINCCGCSACESRCPKSAIAMKYDEEGFLYPVIDENECVDCGLCSQVCPLYEKSEHVNPYTAVFAVYTKDKSILMQATSGGFVTALSLSIIEQGGIVAGVRYDPQDITRTEYAIARTKEEVFSFSSSKYVQSEKKNIYKAVEEELKKGAAVLFVGCPCDVQAMKNYLGAEYGTLLSVELVCMGVSSYKIAESYKEYAEEKNGAKLIRINARSKKKGWFVPHLEEEYEDYQIRCSTLYGTFFGYGMQVYNRPSCFKCRFRGENGVGDIRVGDFWGIKESDPYWNPDGVSCIFARTEKGLSAIEALNGLALYKTDIKTASVNNQSFHSNKSDKYRMKREKFSEKYLKKGLVAACTATGTLSFWIRHLIPDSYHAGLKKAYHKFVDRQ